jgi:hypothetical protein
MVLKEPSSNESAFDGGKLLRLCSMSLSLDSSTMEDEVQLLDIVGTAVGGVIVGSKSSSKMFEDRMFRTTSVRLFCSASYQIKFSF